jgi:hypothetical protein
MWCLAQKVQRTILFKYYISGHNPSSCFYLKHRTVYISKHKVSETGFRPEMGSIDRDSLYLRTESSLRNVVF